MAVQNDSLIHQAIKQRWRQIRLFTLHLKKGNKKASASNNARVSSVSDAVDKFPPLSL